MTFDSWEVAVRPDDDALMHWGIPGMKHGRRRFQNEDGTWTEQGLAERRKREGFGERKAARYERKANKAAARQRYASSDREAAKYGRKASLYTAKKNLANGIISKKEYSAMRKIDKLQERRDKKEQKEVNRMVREERKRKRSLSGLTDEELEAKIKRAKMEQEYRELTKKQRPVLETGAKIVTRILDYKDAKEQRVIDLNRQKIDMERLKTQKIQAKAQAVQAKESTRQAKYRSISDKHKIKSDKYEAEKAAQEARKTEAEVKGGLKYKNKAAYLDSKGKYKEAKRGALSTWLKNKANKDKEQRHDSHELEVIEAKNRGEIDKQRELTNMARAKADQNKYNAEGEKYKADQSRHNAESERYKADQAKTNRRQNETKANTEAAKVKYNKDVDRINALNAGRSAEYDYKRGKKNDRRKHKQTMYKLRHPLSNIP